MERTVKRFRDLVKRECEKHIEQMMLFGSSAKGKRAKDSDIDMLVI